MAADQPVRSQTSTARTQNCFLPLAKFLDRDERWTPPLNESETSASEHAWMDGSIHSLARLPTSVLKTRGNVDVRH